jgi:Mor family transcriptional regulator
MNATISTKTPNGCCLKRVVSVPRGYKRVAAQMDNIASQFNNGASMRRLSRKHSLPLEVIEGVIRMKMLGHANDKLSERLRK